MDGIKLKRLAASDAWDFTTVLSPDVPVEVHTWQRKLPPRRYTSGSMEVVKFVAVLLSPLDASQNGKFQDKYPVAFYYPGIGRGLHVLEKVMAWRGVVQEPFVLVVPEPPKGKLWFIDNDSRNGWLSGEFDADGVELFSVWMQDILNHPRLDANRVGLIGFCSGAYAATELFARGLVTFSGIGIGGLHGHGQPDHEDVPKRYRGYVLTKFNDCLQRLRQHVGVTWFEATHAYSDRVSKWNHAKLMLDAINCRQEELRFPSVVIRLINTEEQDSPAGGRQNRMHHRYCDATFLRTEFFVALFGGSAQCSIGSSPSRKKQTLTGDSRLLDDSIAGVQEATIETKHRSRKRTSPSIHASSFFACRRRACYADKTSPSIDRQPIGESSASVQATNTETNSSDTGNCASAKNGREEIEELFRKSNLDPDAARRLSDPNGEYDFEDLPSLAKFVKEEDLRAVGVKVAAARRLLERLKPGGDIYNNLVLANRLPFPKSVSHRGNPKSSSNSTGTLATSSAKSKRTKMTKISIPKRVKERCEVVTSQLYQQDRLWSAFFNFPSSLQNS